MLSALSWQCHSAHFIMLQHTYNQRRKVTLLKVDVERSELAVLRGVAAEDWHKIDQTAIEVGDYVRCLTRQKRGWRL